MKLGRSPVLALSAVFALCLLGMCPAPALATSIIPVPSAMDCTGFCEAQGPAAGQNTVHNALESWSAGSIGGQFGHSAASVLGGLAGYNLPDVAMGPGASLDGTMSTSFAHMSLRAIPVTAVDGMQVDMAFLEAYSPTAGDLTDGQGLIAVVPEPITMFTLLMGGGSLAGYIRRRLGK